MNTVACYTLGCKVNQYDTQAMLEQFLENGYETVPFSSPADVYVVNTCTVTGTGDKKSLQMVRRALRQNPAAAIVVAGCLAQRRAEDMLLPGVMLVIGTQRRGEVVQLLHSAMERGSPVIAVEQYDENANFEPLQVHRHAERTRAVLKIQEGCSGQCSYCIIPSVRGPIRSSPLEDLALQARSLGEAGYQEIVLTGIHLSSYGRDFSPQKGLLDAIDAVHAPGIQRIRLGSLEPRIVTPDFARELMARDKVCPQYHLALQSGSDDILRAMRRRYTVAQFLAACDALRTLNPDVAITTDILTGFPGEEERHVRETIETMRKAAFARVHVFPFSPREGTPAAALPGQVDKAEKERRAGELIALGETLQQAYIQRFIGGVQPVLFEEMDEEEGVGAGFTPHYVRVQTENAVPGTIQRARIQAAADGQMTGVIETEGANL